MIDALDETIRQLLIRELPITDNEIDIAFDMPKREWSARLSRPTLNLFLYDIRENVALRKVGWEPTATNGNGSVGRKAAPLRVDCHYMLTAWANDPSDEHRLLARAMLVLFRYNELPRPMLAERLQNQAFDIRAKLAAHDKLTNPAEVWGALDNEMRPTVSYILTLTMDPWQEEFDPMVKAMALDLYEAEPNPDTQQAQAVRRDSQMYAFGGQIWQDGRPLATAEVRLKGRGMATVTDTDGRYRLRGLPAGEHTLIIQLADGTAVERPLTIPEPQGNYDIEVESGEISNR